VRFDTHPYGVVAGFYDELAALYSLGRIPATKRLQRDWIARGDRVLYAGVGRGEDALEALHRGARVTAVDLAPRMLERLRRRLGREGLEATLLVGDVARVDLEGCFDVVVANYFLNLFDQAHAEAMLARLVERVAPGGALFIADFAPARGGRLGRWLTALHYRPVNAIVWALGLCAWHPIFDHRAMLGRAGLVIEAEVRLSLGCGPDPAYVSIRARRPRQGSEEGGGAGVACAGASPSARPSS